MSRTWMFPLCLSVSLVLCTACSSPQDCPTTSEGSVTKTTPFQPGNDEEVARLFTHPAPEGEVPWGFKWSPSGRHVVFSRLSTAGGNLQIQPWILDAESGVEQVLFDRPGASVQGMQWFPTGDKLLLQTGGRLVTLGPGGEPAIVEPSKGVLVSMQSVHLSPDGSKAGYVSGQDLYTIDIASGDVERLTKTGSETLFNGEVDWVYNEELELERAYWWAPDSARIAFLQFDESPVTSYPLVYPAPTMPRVIRQRYPQAGEANPTVRLGLVSLGADEDAEPLWIGAGHPEDGYVARVGWTPSGEHVYTITFDRLQRTLRLNFIAPGPNARPRVVLEEQDDQWLNLLDEPHFLGEGSTFLWRSERDGHAHLYVFDVLGHQQRQLTQGDWEVSEVVGVDEEGGQVFFVGNREGPATYQLYSVPLAGGEVRRISQETGCHDVVLSPDHRHYVDIHSSLSRTPRAELRRVDGESVTVIAEEDLNELPDLDQVNAELLTVPGPDGLQYQARMFRPAQLEAGRRYPVLIWVYNGPGAQIVRDQWRTKYIPWMRLLARRGVIVFSMDGRGTHGRGREWEKPIYGRLGEIELADQMRGVEHLRGLEFVDSDRIGVFGWSYGGTMVLHALLRRPGVFSVGVSVAPVTDWRFYDTIYTERYMMTPQENPDGYRDTSLLRHAGELRDPLLLIHGLSDDNVHFRNSSSMIEELVATGRHFDLMVYPGQAHGIGHPDARQHVFSRITGYLLEHLLAH